MCKRRDVVRMEDYSSDSSDSDSQSVVRTLDYSFLTLETNTLQHNIEHVANSAESKPATVETLVLCNNQLTSLPVNVSIFQNLRVLDVSSNSLTYIPDFITECPLSALIAKNNNLDDYSFPKTFWKLSSLKELNLNGNRLSHIPEEVLGVINLKCLYLGGNQIQEVSRDIWRLQGLQILYLGDNQIREIPASIGQLKYLRALNLSDNRLESLPNTVANLKNLKTLLLHKNKLQTLPIEIITLKCLTELSLRDNPLVVHFVSNMTLNPPSLLEHAGRVIKVHGITYGDEDLPRSLIDYLNSAHCCVNPKCKGVFFDNRVEHVKFVDFCGKYRIPLLQYLCSSRCIEGEHHNSFRSTVGCHSDNMMKKVLLG